MPPSTTRSTFNATSSPAARSGRSEPRRPLHGRQPRLRPKRARHPDLCDFASVPVTTPGRLPSGISQRLGRLGCSCTLSRFVPHRRAPLVSTGQEHHYSPLLMHIGQTAQGMLTPEASPASATRDRSPTVIRVEPCVRDHPRPSSARTLGLGRQLCPSEKSHCCFAEASIGDSPINESLAKLTSAAVPPI